MFVGESAHSMDAKGRIHLPKRFQEVLDRDADGNLRAVLTRGFERCVFLFSESGFARVLARLETQAFGGPKLRKMQRLFFANTYRVQLDASGRVLVPDKLKAYADLEKEVVLVGVADRAELWSKRSWEAFESEATDQYDQLDTVLCGGEPSPDGGS